MASSAILQATAAASRRRSFAASQNKGTTAPASPTPPAPGAPVPVPSPGPVAGISALNKAPAAPASTPYVAHAIGLSQAAQANGAPDLASAIRAVAAVPHPADKQQVAVNYLKSQPPAVAQKHAHMFTKTLMTGGSQ